MAVKIITDSTSDLSKKDLDKYNIDILSLYVTFNGNSVKDANINNEEFFRRMENEGIPTSSQPAVGDMMEKMEKALKNGDDLVCVFLSSALSGTYQSALLVKDILLDKYPNSSIEMIDSESTSMEMGLAVLEGAKLAKEGKSFKEVVDKIKSTINKTRFIFIPDNLDYLHKGGRIGGAKTLFGNMFKITPILTVKDKKADILQTVRTKRRAKATLIKKLLEDNEKYNVEEVVVHHINAYEEAEKLQEDLEKEIDVKMQIMDIGPIIGLHVGPKAVGFAYRCEKEIEKDK